MDVTYYLADAITGVIRPGVTLPLTGARMEHDFRGGSFTATLPTHLDLTETTQSEWRWWSHILPLLEAGTASIVPVLDGTDVRAPMDLGEWVIWGTETEHISGEITLTGSEWHAYPKFRALERDYIYDGWDVGQVLYEVLLDCYKTRQDALALTIPKRDMGGQRVTLDQRRKTQYYSDLLEQLADLSPFEWIVSSHPVWKDDVPVRMAREVIAVAPEWRNPQQVELIGATPGSPGGAIMSWSTTTDATKSAASVFLFGKGQGDKQITSDAPNVALLDGKHVIVTAYETDSRIEDQTALNVRARALADAAAHPREAVQARINLTDFPQLPSLGDVFPVRLDPRPTIPAGLIGSYRVGRTSFSPRGDLLTIDVLLEEA